MTLSRLWRASDDLGHVTPWNPVIAEKHAALTARMLLGAAGPARVTGSRVDEAILLDRERRLQALRARQQRDRFRKAG